MTEVEVKILKLDGICGFPDVLCSVYSNNTLLDAFTLEDQLVEPILFSVSGSLKQMILITVKCISLNVFIGFAKFRLDDLVDFEFVLTLPLALPRKTLENQEIPTVSLQLVRNKVKKSKKRAKSLVFQSNQYKRSEWNKWEGQVVKNLHKLNKIKNKFKTKMKEIKESNEKFPLDYKHYKDLMKSGKKTRFYRENEKVCKEIIFNNGELEVEYFNNQVIISSLVAEESKMNVEINFFRKLLRIHSLDVNIKTDDELFDEIRLKENDLKNATQKIEDLDCLIKKNLEDIVALSQENFTLRREISSLEQRK
jgi:hypothetical protein